MRAKLMVRAEQVWVYITIVKPIHDVKQKQAHALLVPTSSFFETAWVFALLVHTSCNFGAGWAPSLVKMYGRLFRGWLGAVQPTRPRIESLQYHIMWEVNLSQTTPPTSHPTQLTYPCAGQPAKPMGCSAQTEVLLSRGMGRLQTRSKQPWVLAPSS